MAFNAFNAFAIGLSADTRGCAAIAYAALF
jgi:hypothetical protein